MLAGKYAAPKTEISQIINSLFIELEEPEEEELEKYQDEILIKGTTYNGNKGLYTAITKCKTLLLFIDLSLSYKNIVLDDRQAEVWAKYVLDVKNMAVRWHYKDRERMK